MPDLEHLDVCFVAGTLRRGGTERQLDYVVRALQDQGAKLRVVSLDEGEFWERAFRMRGIRVSSLAAKRSKAARLAALVALLRRERPQIIHAFHFPVNLYAVAAAYLLGCRNIGSLRGDMAYSVNARGLVYGPLSLRCPELLVVNSHRALDAARRRGIAGDRLFMLPNVVDTDLYRPGGEARQGPFTILFVGRNVPQKRFDRFVRLLAAVRRQVDREIRGMVIGDVGSCANGLEVAIRENGLPRSALELRGVLEPSEVAEAYGKADLFVLTSDFEGTPNALLEAMACGLPCVATACGDVPRVLDGDRGRIVQVDDDDALTRSVLSLVADEGLRAQLGRRARAFIEREHSVSRLSGMLHRLYSASLSA